MSQHPIRLIVDDDLRRSRLTVLFRLPFGLPLLIWLSVWTQFAAVALLVAYAATLARGAMPRPLHRFLAAYVRCAAHTGAYLTLAADPYPSFLGDSGYPLDVDIPPPARQSRWKTGLRLLLALPALALASAMIGAGGSQQRQIGLLATVGLLGWFASLVRGAMPAGMRNLAAFGLRYLAQVAAYLFLLTDRYPDSDPRLPGAPSRAGHPVALVMDDDDRARSRLNVLFLLPLAMPHVLWLALWTLPVAIALPVAWLLTLALGRTPARLHRFLAAYARYTTHLTAFVYVVGGRFPGFTGRAGSYPVDLAIAPPVRQRRVRTLLRLPLAVPAAMIAAALSPLLAVLAVTGWFAALALGRMPEGLRRLGGYALGYGGQLAAYGILLLTDRYPDSDPGGTAAGAVR